MKRLPGCFGYALYTDGNINSYATLNGQFAFDCLGSIDLCDNGFTMTLWFQPKLSTSSTSSDFGVFSASNSHRGIHVVYVATDASYWLIVRDNITEFRTKFQLVDNIWSQLLVTWDKSVVLVYVNGFPVPMTQQIPLSGSSYPVVQVHFGKASDGVLSMDGFSGGIDNLFFWQESVGDIEAFHIYCKLA